MLHMKRIEQCCEGLFLLQTFIMTSRHVPEWSGVVCAHHSWEVFVDIEKGLNVVMVCLVLYCNLLSHEVFIVSSIEFIRADCFYSTDYIPV